MTSEPHLMTFLEGSLARIRSSTTKSPERQTTKLHEYLRYAVLRVLEGEVDHLPADWTPIDAVTIGYGIDEAMFDSWGSSEDCGTPPTAGGRVPASGCSSRKTTRRFPWITSLLQSGLLQSGFTPEWFTQG